MHCSMLGGQASWSLTTLLPPQIRRRFRVGRLARSFAYSPSRFGRTSESTLLRSNRPLKGGELQENRIKQEELMQSRKFDPKVFQLGYVALGTPDVARTKDHYLKIVGMTEVARGDDGSVYLSIGYNHHDIVLRPAEEKALVHVGFHLKPHIAIDEFAREAREAGLATTIKTDSQPGVAKLVEVVAPGGVVIQCYDAIAAAAPSFKHAGATP